MFLSFLLISNDFLVVEMETVEMENTNQINIFGRNTFDSLSQYINIFILASQRQHNKIRNNMGSHKLINFLNNLNS